MPSIGSVTKDMRGLEDSGLREDAAAKLWERFFALLSRHARAKLRTMGVPLGAADEEDVAARAFAKVCRDIEIGRLRLASRDDLQKLLLSAASRGAINVAKRARRDAGPGGEHAFLLHLAAPEGSPESDLLMREGVLELLDSLRDDDLRRVVLWKLQGHTNEEIRRKKRCSLATVERQIDLARARLAKHVPGRLAQPGPRGASGPAIEIGDSDGSAAAVLDAMDGRP